MSIKKKRLHNNKLHVRHALHAIFNTRSVFLNGEKR